MGADDDISKQGVERQESGFRGPIGIQARWGCGAEVAVIFSQGALHCRRLMHESDGND